MTINDLSLSEPIYAAFYLIIFICLIPVVFVYLLRKMDSSQNTADYKLLIVIAEILGSIGLIASLTFAGRSELNTDKYNSEKEYTRSIATLNRDVQVILVLPMCISAVASLDVEEVSLNGLCTFLKKYNHENTLVRYWKYAKNTSNFMADKLITSGEIVQGLKFSILASSITTFLNAQNEQSKSESKLFHLKKQNESVFILICAVLVGIGVSIKIARAFLEWKKEKVKLNL